MLIKSSVNHEIPTTNHQPPTADHQPLSTNHQPSTVNRQPPSSIRHSPTTNHQPPTTIHQPSTHNRMNAWGLLIDGRCCPRRRSVAHLQHPHRRRCPWPHIRTIPFFWAIWGGKPLAGRDSQTGGFTSSSNPGSSPRSESSRRPP